MLKDKALLLNALDVTVMPFYGVDTFEWTDYRNAKTKQQKSEVEKMDWENAIGLAIVSGSYKVEDTKVLKFKSDKEFTSKEVETILKVFSLSENYPWIFAGKDGKSLAVVVRFEYLRGTSYIRGTWKGYRVHITMEGEDFIPDYFTIPTASPETVNLKIVNSFLHSMPNVRGLPLDENNYKMYYNV